MQKLSNRDCEVYLLESLFLGHSIAGKKRVPTVHEKKWWQEALAGWGPAICSASWVPLGVKTMQAVSHATIPGDWDPCEERCTGGMRAKVYHWGNLLKKSKFVGERKRNRAIPSFPCIGFLCFSLKYTVGEMQFGSSHPFLHWNKLHILGLQINNLTKEEGKK